MSLCYVIITIFFVSALNSSIVHSRSYNTGLIFYDLKSQRAYLPPTVSVSRGRKLNSVQYSDKGSIWSTFGKPCECQGPLCGCCAGLKVNQFNFDQKMCANVTYSLKRERIFLEVFLNQEPASKYGISARNPSPLCIPIMMPIPMAMCVQMSNIAVQGNNLNMCMDFVVRLASTELFEMHFQCMKMGLDGFQYVDKDGKPVIPAGSIKTNDNDNEYYDETSSDAKAGDEREHERDDNVIDNVIEIDDDYDTKPYKGQMDMQGNDDTINKESSAETETEAEEDNAKEGESPYEDNEQEIANAESDENEEEIIEEESQTETYDVPKPITTIDNESYFTPIEEKMIMTTTITTTTEDDDSYTTLNEVTTTEFAESTNLETTTQAFTVMPDIMIDISTQSVIDKVNDTSNVLNNVTAHNSASEDSEVKHLQVSAQVSTNLTMATNATAIDPDYVPKDELIPPTSRRMLSAKRMRKAKPKPKRKQAENPISMFRRLFEFF